MQSKIRTEIGGKAVTIFLVDNAVSIAIDGYGPMGESNGVVVSVDMPNCVDGHPTVYVWDDKDTEVCQMIRLTKAKLTEK